MTDLDFESRTFGDFIENLQEYKKEFLILGFSPGSVSLPKWWPNNGLSADFISDYLTAFLPDAKNKDNIKKLRSKIKESVNYIANEILENSIKFRKQDSNSPIKFGLYIVKNNCLKVILTTTNTTSLSDLEEFQIFIENFLASDPDSFYLNQLEKTFESDSSSGLGLISIQNDYHAKLGWKIEASPLDKTSATITTMIQVEYDLDSYLN